MSKNDLNEPAGPVYRTLMAPVLRALSRLKSGIAKGIDAHHERAASLRVHQAEKLDGASASKPKSRSAQTGGSQLLSSKN